MFLAAVAVKRPILREWSTWRFEHGKDDAKREAARRLVELGALDVVESGYRERFTHGDERAKESIAAELVSVGAQTLAEDFYLAEILSGDHDRLDPAVTWFQEHGDAATARKLLSNLHAVMESPDIQAHDRSDAVQGLYGAVSVITEREKRNVVPVLLEIVKKPSSRPGQEYQARICATYLLAELGSEAEGAVAELRRHLNDEDEAFRDGVQRALDAILRATQRASKPGR